MAQRKPKAYSYLRFSTPQQMQGDSYRRQLEAAREYATRHSLELDEELSFEDLGVSAFRSSNALSGALHQFTQAVDTGLVEPGSYLLIENLDRLSRDKVRIALRRFEDILERGVNIVTLMDGKVWTTESLDDIAGLIVSLLSMARAHEESKTKSERVRKAWKNKRSQAVNASIPLTTRAPGWLEWDEKSKAFQPIPDRAKVIRSIFEEASLGAGPTEIADRLNRDKVPTFGQRKRKIAVKRPRPEGGWYPSYVQKILNSPSVIGTYQPMRIVYGQNGTVKRVPDGPAITGYFPPVVSETLWNTVQALRTARKP